MTAAEITPTSWFVQIFEVADSKVQELVHGLLSGIAGVVVETPKSGADHFIVTECGEPGQAQAIGRLVSSIDIRARLIHTSNGSSVEPPPA